MASQIGKNLNLFLFVHYDSFFLVRFINQGAILSLKVEIYLLLLMNYLSQKDVKLAFIESLNFITFVSYTINFFSNSFIEI